MSHRRHKSPLDAPALLHREGVRPNRPQGFSTLRRVLQACGFDIRPVLVPFERDPERDARLQDVRRMTPEERLAGMMRRLEER